MTAEDFTAADLAGVDLAGADLTATFFADLPATPDVAFVAALVPLGVLAAGTLWAPLEAARETAPLPGVLGTLEAAFFFALLFVVDWGALGFAVEDFLAELFAIW
ncbi:MAG: hypothetical protein ACNA71_06825 [Kiritimatiellia bacterium]